MSKQASPTVIGMFTLVGLILAGVATVLFGAGKFLTRTHDILLYFEKSANGLQVGSDVRFGGVRIGSVKSMSVLVDRQANRKIIPVVVQIADKDLRLISTNDAEGIDFATFEGVRKAVAQGLRAGMKQQSLVTGQLYIEFDVVPNSPGFTYQSGSPPEHPVVPTIGTEMDELISGISDGIQKFNALDLDSVIVELRGVLVTAREQLAGLDLKGINQNVIGITEDLRKVTRDEKIAAAVDHLDDALAQLDELVKKSNAGFDPLLAKLDAILAKTDAGLARIEEASRELAGFANPRSPAQLRLQQVLQETERATRALKELSTDLKRNPNALISGKAEPE
jgi:paraquat-inducible protein B